ncbi:hypothetical protein, variant [Exophiala mesophila]|uniref:Thiol methyltransferase 2 n=1 Tax=Exophiala mesophila TaxID=212818 RepID=A0A0D1ZRW7_EXOME|nr:hypothetical protein, variant [Exophiala mesophila]KIV96709.1 hypothetical protein, variant [Exophiala mesophila]
MTDMSKPQRRDLPVAEARVELQRHFDKFKGNEYGTGWAKLWEQGDFLPWDRMAPSPALAETLIDHAIVVGRAVVDEDGQQRRKKALVPGCGRGVDVLLLESFGYDAVGLEYAADAVKAAEEYAQDHAEDHPVRDAQIGKGSHKFVHGDFYKDDWLEEAGVGHDVVQFFCAMQPSMRPAWAKRMSELLRPSPLANLICLEFPTTKSAETGGPPWASPSIAYREHLSHPGKEIKYDAEGNIKINPLAPDSPGALERVAHFHPNDTHKVGKDENGNVMDNIAIWRHH